MGILTRAADALADESARPFAPALGTSQGWTLRDYLLDALGCHRNAEPVAYWQWHDIYTALRQACDHLAAQVDLPERMDVEQWANQPERTGNEVLSCLRAAADHNDVEGPDPVVLRPWCRVQVASMTRIPYTPIGAIVFAWERCGGTVRDLVDSYDLDRLETSWELLAKLDPHLVQASPPERLEWKTWQLRGLIAPSTEAAARSETKWLVQLAEIEPDVDLDTLLQRAPSSNLPVGAGV